ncbi:MAG: hypothetical protein J1E82_08505 [Muribaculaceae bacterium]|nr:hypothetical protein [Muribaculaceae bacterium]
MKFLQLHKIALLGVISLMGVMASCNDESLTLPEEGGQTPGNSLTDYIEFRMSLPVMETRGEADFETYDDEVDLKEVRLLFFTADDDLFFKQFEYEDLQYIPVGETEYEPNHTTKVWYVRIPVDDPVFVKTIREKDFKIAVLANWKPTIALEEGDNLSTLHHQEEEKTYTYLTEGTNKMGKNTNWVKCYIDEENLMTKLDSRSDAETWIKTNWDPSNKSNYRDYEDLWLLWNFHAALNGEVKITEGQSSNFGSFEDEWIEKNQDDLKEWLEGKNEDPETGPETTPADKTKLQTLAPLESDNGGFQFIEANGAYVDEKNGVTGVVLPKGAYNQDAIRFKAQAAGYLRIIWGSADGNNAKMQIERRTIESSQNFTEKKEPSGSSAAVNKYEWSVSITGDSEWITIFSQTGNVIIYEIEYIQDKYLYDTNRIGVTPGPDSQLIPMYGIQKYGKLGEVWKEGTTFDLSNFNQMGPSGYNYSDIWLLRSVAKVELLIPKKMKAHHIYLRSQNRYAYCEPVDISSNTNDIWKNIGDKDKEAEGWSTTEWGKIMNRNPFYKSSDYEGALKWYYGRWFNTTGLDQYPQVINPKISRSDFTEFVSAGEDEKGNLRYVLYIGEKFVDDPNDVGDATSLPKVCHIEFRTGDDPFLNLDDNNCYRIYFIDRGVDPEFVENVGYPDFGKDEDGNDNTWERLYEQDTDYLKKHWPIIRNHVYSFTVEAGKEYISAHLKVLPWHKKDVDIWW